MSKEVVPADRIAASIQIIRGQKVLLDFDLAALYGVATKVLNQAVKRNLARFPRDFMFPLNAEEAGRLRSQIVTLNVKPSLGKRPLRSQIVTLKRGEHRKYRPYAFTEQGVAMLSEIGFHVRETPPRYGTQRKR